MTTATKLINEYADLALQAREIDARLKALRPGVLALGEGTHETKRHLLTIDTTERASISVAVAKAFLTPVEIAAATVEQVVTTIRVDH